MRAITFIIVLSLAVFVYTIAQGQNENNLKNEVNSQGTPTFLTFDTNTGLPKAAEKQALFTQVLGMTVNDELRFRRIEPGNSGFTHEIYDQFYKNVRVESGAYVLHVKNGNIERMNGSFQKISGLNVIPSISESEAVQRAVANVGAAIYKWQVPTQEKMIKKLMSDTIASFYPKAQLLIYKDTEVENQYYLAYRFIIDSQKPDASYYVYVDAHTGKILSKTSALERITDATGTAATRHSGSQSIVTDQISGTFRLRESGRGGGIHTLQFGTATDFTDADNNWTAAEYHNAAMDDAALDVHWAMEKTYDYWQNVHSRNSYNNSGGLIRSLVHEPGVGANWNPATLTMTFGDGGSANGMNYDPLTSLDICAHEFGHGVAQFTVNFNTSNEARALNEGFSDIWGSSVEAYAAPGKNAWITGEEVITGGAGYERSLSNPQANSYPDVYLGANWDFSGSPDPRKNATVLSHWFYLLATGGTDRNSSGTVYSINGVGRQNAEQITFLGERAYLAGNPGATYSDTRTAMIAAATERHGTCSNEVIATTNAWYAVGVGNAFPTLDGYFRTGGTNYSMQTVNSVQSGWNEVHLYVNSASWSVLSANPSPVNWYVSNNVLYFNLNSGQSVTFSVSTSSASCGATSRNVTFYIPSSYYAYTVSPNPAKDYLTIEFENSQEEKNFPESIELFLETTYGTVTPVRKLEIRDKASVQQLRASRKFTFDVRDLARGRYILRVTKEKQVETETSKKVETMHIVLN